ncbi:hypothetical protein L289_1930 [Acinetobacter gerneri DSM 14967 = CIP 107464 = MTCC 9824]|nr:hypothetical protein L289_1930 [Acinetobacter gerneri DSM 14967 = CIP 107464 = MTCC 9824]
MKIFSFKDPFAFVFIVACGLHFYAVQTMSEFADQKIDCQCLK